MSGSRSADYLASLVRACYLQACLRYAIRAIAGPGRHEVPGALGLGAFGQDLPDVGVAHRTRQAAASRLTLAGEPGEE